MAEDRAAAQGREEAVDHQRAENRAMGHGGAIVPDRPERAKQAGLRAWSANGPPRRRGGSRRFRSCFGASTRRDHKDERELGPAPRDGPGHQQSPRRAAAFPAHEEGR